LRARHDAGRKKKKPARGRVGGGQRQAGAKGTPLASSLACIAAGGE